MERIGAAKGIRRLDDLVDAGPASGRDAVVSTAPTPKVIALPVS
jgi:hypothetical protein